MFYTLRGGRKRASQHLLYYYIHSKGNLVSGQPQYSIDFAYEQRRLVWGPAHSESGNLNWTKKSSRRFFFELKSHLIRSRTAPKIRRKNQQKPRLVHGKIRYLVQYPTEDDLLPSNFDIDLCSYEMYLGGKDESHPQEYVSCPSYSSISHLNATMYFQV